MIFWRSWIMKVCPNKVSNDSNTKFKVYLDFNIKTNGSFLCLESIVTLAQLKQENSRIWFLFSGRRVQIYHQVDLQLFFPIFEHYRFYFGTCKMARLDVYGYFMSINCWAKCYRKWIFKVLKEVSNCMRSNLVTRAHVGIIGIMVEEIQKTCSKSASIG